MQFHVTLVFMYFLAEQEHVHKNTCNYYSYCWKCMCTTMYVVFGSACYYSATLQFSGVELSYIHNCILGQHMPCSLLQGYQRTLMFLSSLKWLRYVISLLILRGIRFIIFILQVMMTVIIIKYYFKIVSLEIAATWKFPWVKWQGLGRLFTIADMVNNCIEWGILPVTSQCLFSMLLFMHFIDRMQIWRISRSARV